MRLTPLLFILALTSCTTGAAVEPIPGSITYGGQPRSKLEKSPVGSIVNHDFIMTDGKRAYETYRIEPDRSLTLLNRVIMSDLPPDNR